MDIALLGGVTPLTELLRRGSWPEKAAAATCLAAIASHPSTHPRLFAAGAVQLIIDTLTKEVRTGYLPVLPFQPYIDEVTLKIISFHYR